MRIVVRGIPAAQGSKRHVGGGRMIESSRAVGPWREAVRAETQRAMEGLGPLQGPLAVDVQFRLPRPKGHYRTGRNAHLLRDGAPHWPSTKPDIDKLARAVLDGLTTGGAWGDDAQVVMLITGKGYADPARPPGCMIDFESLEES